LQLLPCFGTILHGGAHLVEKVQSLVNLALSIGWVGTLLRRNRPTADAGISHVVTAIHVATAIGGATAGIAYRASQAVTDRARLTSASLTCLPIARELAGLELLATRLIARLAIGLAGTSAEASQLIAQTRKIVHGAIDRGVFGSVLSAA
jgi:hypothetical protein